MSDITERSYRCANDHGFYEDYDRLMLKLEDPKDRTFVKQIWLSHRLMLIVSELAEGLEAIRDLNFSLEPKSSGLGEELADARIRLEDLFRHIFGGCIDFDKIVRDKIAINEQRPYKHGRSL